jgi:hypothetical protein
MISLCCLCVYVSVCISPLPPIVVRQQNGKQVPAETHATTEELLDASFSLRSVSYQRNASDWCFSELLVICYVRSS